MKLQADRTVESVRLSKWQEATDRNAKQSTVKRPYAISINNDC